ncbi:DUF7681 family protein [Desulfomicrobium apsheronum]|uniref:Acb2/Tad1 domain-containing protein n=1 Tax=Desulfomicrobium apsheronum TaxID=52560 RepID=UPI00116043E9
MEDKNPFVYVKPTDLSVEQITIVRDKCKELNDILLSLNPSRERSLAITKLEEVSMWANKSIVFNQVN